MAGALSGTPNIARLPAPAPWLLTLPMPSIREQLETKLRRYEELERQMADPAVLAEGAKLAAVAREHGSISRVATARSP